MLTPRIKKVENEEIYRRAEVKRRVSENVVPKKLTLFCLPMGLQ